MTKSLESLRLAKAGTAVNSSRFSNRGMGKMARDGSCHPEVSGDSAGAAALLCPLHPHPLSPDARPVLCHVKPLSAPIPAGSARRHGSGTISRPLGQPSAPVSPGGPGHAALGVGGGGPSLSEYQDLRPVCLIWCLRRYFLPLASRLHKGPPDAISVRRPS